MAEESVVIVLSLTDELSRMLAKAVAGVDDFDEKVAGADDSTKRAGDSTEQFGGKLGGMGKLAAAGAVALAGIVVAFGAVSGAASMAFDILSDGVEAWGEQEEATGRLADNLGRAGVQGEALVSRMQDIGAIAGELAGDTLFGDEDITLAAAKYVQLTGDASVATRELDTILGIATSKRVEAADASELYAKSLKGDIGALKDLTPLTAKQEEELGKLKGTAEQTTRVQALLEAQFAGLAQQVDPTTLALNNQAAAHGDLLQAVGAIINESGLIPAVMEPITAVFRKAEAAIYDNSEQLQSWVLGGVKVAASALVGFLDGVVAALPLLDAMMTTVRVMANVWTIWHRSVTVVYKSIAGFLVKVVGVAIEKLGEFAELAAHVADAVGLSGMAGDLLDAQAAGDSFKKSVDGLADGIDASLAEDVAAIKGDAQDIADAYESAGDAAAAAKPFVEGARDAVREMGKGLDDAVKKVKKIDPTTAGVDRVSSTASDKTTAETAKLAGAKVDLEAGSKAAAAALRDELAAMELQALMTQDPRLHAYLEYKIAVREAQAGELTQAEYALEMKRAELQLNQELIDIEKERAEGEADRLERAQKGWKELGGAIRSISTGVGAIDKVGGALGDMSDTAFSTFKAFEEGNENAGQAAVDGLGSAGSAVTGFAEAAGASAQVQAGILALFSAAQAAAAFATPGLQAQGVQHVIAAGLYAMAAGTSAPSAGSGAGASSGGGAGRGASAAMDPRELIDLQAQAIADALGGGAGQSLTIVLDQRGGINGAPTPEMERKIGQAAKRGLASQGIRLTGLNMRRR